MITYCYTYSRLYASLPKNYVHNKLNSIHNFISMMSQSAAFIKYYILPLKSDHIELDQSFMTFLKKLEV